MTPRAQAAVVADNLLAAWNARDLAKFTSLLTENVYWHDLGMPHPPAVGRAAVRPFSESILRAFPDFRYEIRAPMCIAEDGSAAVIPWTITATNTGVLEPPGFAATGRRVCMSGLGATVDRAVGHANQPRHQHRVLAQQARDVRDVDARLAKQLTDLDQETRRRRQLLRNEPKFGFRECRCRRDHPLRLSAQKG